MHTTIAESIHTTPKSIQPFFKYFQLLRDKIKHYSSTEGFQTCTSNLLLDKLGVYKTDSEIAASFFFLCSMSTLNRIYVYTDVS